MQPTDMMSLVFVILAVVAGIGLLLVRVNPEQLSASTHSAPGFALFRFRAYRYGAALFCFALAALGTAMWSGLV